MKLSNRSDLVRALKLGGLRADKNKSQHFLVDEEVLDQIITAANLTTSDTVVEIGAGAGVLTSELSKHVSKVITYETDQQYANILRRMNMANVEVVNQDFLSGNLNNLAGNYKVVANLPYAITSAILRKLITSSNKPSKMILLVQYEVAARICASAGAMSLLALSVQYYAQAKIINKVAPSSFYPPPKVDSAVLHIQLRSKPYFQADERELFRLFKVGFSSRRKMLKNNLAAGYGLSNIKLEHALKSANILLNSRAQELSLDDWHKLYTVIISDL